MKDDTLEEWKEFYRNSPLQTSKDWSSSARGQRSENSLDAFMWWGHELYLREKNDYMQPE